MRRALALSNYELRLVTRCLLQPSDALGSKLVFLIGLAYLFVPLDLIPDRLPYIGHLDEIGFVLAGLVAARALAPRALQERAVTGVAAEWLEWRRDVAFAIRVLRADLGNFSLFHYRKIDAFLITGKNSGTHWLKFMLSCAIARQYNVPAPTLASGPAADAIIGHPKHAPLHLHIPRIGSSHSIPSVAFAWNWRLLEYPRAVVLVRDIRQALLSNYVKWRQTYDTPLAEFVRGDPGGRRFVADIWWYIHFFNRWGDLARARPGHILVVRYEDVQASPAYWLRRVADHMGISLGDAAVAAGLQYVDRGAVQAVLDPDHAETIIPEGESRARAAFSEEDRRALDMIMRRHLRHGMGYDYPMRDTPAVAAPPWGEACDVASP